MRKPAAFVYEQGRRYHREAMLLIVGDCEIGRLVDAIAKGAGRYRCAGSEIDVAEQRAQDDQGGTRRVPPPAEPIALHPTILARYEQQLERLQESLASCVEARDREAAQTMRDWIQSVTVLRDDSKQGGVIVTHVSGTTCYPCLRAVPWDGW